MLAHLTLSVAFSFCARKKRKEKNKGTRIRFSACGTPDWVGAGEMHVSVGFGSSMMRSTFVSRPWLASCAVLMVPLARETSSWLIPPAWSSARTTCSRGLDIQRGERTETATYSCSHSSTRSLQQYSLMLS